RTRDAIAASLEFNDRIIDTLRAQCLLATWYLKMGRTLEGYNVICSMARFAVGCELNRIVSPVWKLVDGNNPSDPNSSLNVSKDLRRVTSHIGLGVGLPSLAATAAAASSSTTNGPLLDREGNVDVFQSIMSSNLTNPRKISLGFGTADPGSAMAMSSSSSYHMAAAAAAANGRRLNESSNSSMVKVNPILDAPRNSKDLGDRILLFWRIFNMDRFWSVVCGLQPALSEDE
ncbi:3806_t:CDS:2, partial [Acaulospora colombiana]